MKKRCEDIVDQLDLFARHRSFLENPVLPQRFLLLRLESACCVHGRKFLAFRFPDIAVLACAVGIDHLCGA